MIDDFVFICILVGNNFLPNLPHLDIADGALNHMMNIYKVWRGRDGEGGRAEGNDRLPSARIVAMGCCVIGP